MFKGEGRDQVFRRKARLDAAKSDKPLTGVPPVVWRKKPQKPKGEKLMSFDTDFSGFMEDMGKWFDKGKPQGPKKDEDADPAEWWKK